MVRFDTDKPLSYSFLAKIALPVLLVMVLLALSSLVLTFFSPKSMFRDELYKNRSSRKTDSQ